MRCNAIGSDWRWNWKSIKYPFENVDIRILEGLRILIENDVHRNTQAIKKL